MLTLPRSGQPEPGAPSRPDDAAAAPGGAWERVRHWVSSGAASSFLTVAAVTAFVVAELHPALIFSPAMDVGGDNAAHVVAVDYFIHHLLPHGQLSGWDPQWFGGFPLYVFYFPLPPLLAALFNLFVSYAVAFKLVTVLGTVLMPLAAWAFGRMAGFRRPIPALMSVSMLAYLFNTSYTIDGGNIVSTMAGEFSFSLALTLSLFFLGVFCVALRTGRLRFLAALLFALTALSHVVPALFAAAAAAGFALAHLDRSAERAARAARRAGLGTRRRSLPARVVAALPQPFLVLATTGVVGGLLAAFWLVPFGAYLRWSASMGYTRVSGFTVNFLPGTTDNAIVALAAAGVVLGLVRRNREVIVLGVLAGLELLAFFYLPDGLVYNARWLPFWFLTVCLLAAYLLGEGARLLARTGWVGALVASAAFLGLVAVVTPRGSPSNVRVVLFSYAAGALVVAWALALSARHVASAPRRGRWAAVGAPVALSIAGLVATAAYCGSLPGYTTPAGALDEAPGWASFNYTGYQGKPGWHEFSQLVAMLQSAARIHGCGRLDYEYSPNTTDAYGSTLVPMSFPMWTNGCIQVEEGVYYESSTAIYYHFLDQAELSLNASNPVANLPYGPLDVADGIRHLQLTGVKYFLASSPTVEQQAAADPQLVAIGSSPESASVVDRLPGAPQPPSSATFSYVLYEIRNSPLVVPLHRQPVIEHLSQLGWRSTSIAWYQQEQDWPVEIAASGPQSWPVEAPGTLLPASATAALEPTRVSEVAMGDQRVSFRVSRTGVPVLVKVPYFPAWHARGALGPYEATPDLMVVVPTAHDVVLTYGPTAVDWAGRAASLLGVAGLVAVRGRVPPPVRPAPPEAPADTTEDTADASGDASGAGEADDGGPMAAGDDSPAPLSEREDPEHGAVAADSGAPAAGSASPAEEDVPDGGPGGMP